MTEDPSVACTASSRRHTYVAPPSRLTTASSLVRSTLPPFVSRSTSSSVYLCVILFIVRQFASEIVASSAHPSSFLSLFTRRGSSQVAQGVLENERTIIARYNFVDYFSKFTPSTYFKCFRVLSSNLLYFTSIISDILRKY